jgi:hypothetical protein
MEHNEMLPECVQVIKRIDDTLDRIESRVCQHISEGEREGGFRDRIIKLEITVQEILSREIKELKIRFWSSAIIGGLIGALLGSGSNDILAMFIKWIMGK